MSFDRVSVIGLGYIGLPTAAMFASKQKTVIGVDVNQHTVDTINRGEVHIIEPELDAIVRSAVTGGRLQAVIDPMPADAFLITVPTPLKSNDSRIPEPDLSFIESASRAIGPVLKKGDLVILESTSPAGTTEQLAKWLAGLRQDLSFPQDAGEDADVNVAYCPERVLPGHTIRELVDNERVIGGMTRVCSARAVELYKTFVKGDCFIASSPAVAEITKLAENTFRDVNIAFANELSAIADRFDINVWEVIELANKHPRVDILRPGVGVGGHCIAVDPWFLLAGCADWQGVIKSAREVNDNKPLLVVEKIIEVAHSYQSEHRCGTNLSIACYGLSFKPNIDDTRNSPAITIVKHLLEYSQFDVLVVEPHIVAVPTEVSGAKLVTVAEARYTADLHVVLVNHDTFKQQLFDGLNYLDFTRAT